MVVVRHAFVILFKLWCKADQVVEVIELCTSDGSNFVMWVKSEMDHSGEGFNVSNNFISSVRLWFGSKVSIFQMQFQYISGGFSIG